MARSPIFVEAKTAAGVPVPSATMTVTKRSDGTNATIYGVESGGSSISNPVAADSMGRMGCWVDRGEYNAAIAGTGITGYTIPVNATPAADREMDSLWIPANYGTTTVLTNTGAGTSPAGPADGDNFIWAPAIAQVSACQFRYHSASLSPYKWECTGGRGWAMYNGGAVTRSYTNGTFTNFHTGWSGGSINSFTAPFTGEYDVDAYISLSTASSSTQTTYIAGISVNGSSSTQFPATSTLAVAGWNANLHMNGRVTVTAGDTIDIRGSVSLAGTWTLTRNSIGINVVPARIL